MPKKGKNNKAKAPVDSESEMDHDHDSKKKNVKLNSNKSKNSKEHEEEDIDSDSAPPTKKRSDPNACAASSTPAPAHRSISPPLPDIPLPVLLAGLHIDELSRTAGSKKVANCGKVWIELLGALRNRFHSKDLEKIKPQIDAMEAAIVSTVDSYVDKKNHESAEIAAKDAANNQAKELAERISGCRCSTGACADCTCSKVKGGAGFCTVNCSCKKNCSIAKYKEKEDLEALMEEAANRARANVLKKAKEKKKKAANERAGISSSSESEEEIVEKKKKKKSKKESSSSSSESDSDKKKKKKKKVVSDSD